MELPLYRYVTAMPHHLSLLVIVFLDICTTSGNSWLFFGKLHASSTSSIEQICLQMPLEPEQKQYCKNHTKIMEHIRNGTVMAMEECQYQFRNERWNCSSADESQGFGKVLKRGESDPNALNSITSAAVAHEVTMACSRGELTECSCDGQKRMGSDRDQRGRFEWAGCSDDVQFGMSVAKIFVNTKDNALHDARAIMNVHNNRAGRKTVKSFIKRVCKCHGATDTCPLRTCWDQLDAFRLSGDQLKRKYDGASRVTVKQGSRKMTLHTTVSSHKTPTKRDLVYLEDSPNYCVRNEATGSLGTSGRECNVSSKGIDGCSLLCCGRGHDTSSATRTIQDCAFHWCCEVRCTNYTDIYDLYTCKPEPMQEDPTQKTISSTTTDVSSAAPTRNSGTTLSTSSKGRKSGRRRNKKNRRRKGRRKGRRGRRQKNTTGPVRAKRNIPDHEEDDVDIDVMDLNEEVEDFSLDFDEDSSEKYQRGTWDKNESRELYWFTKWWVTMQRFLYHDRSAVTG
ncbi:wnt signaling ligand [Ciona intestinalis]